MSYVVFIEDGEVVARDNFEVVIVLALEMAHSGSYDRHIEHIFDRDLAIDLQM